ncbi:MAG: phage head closure protein [Oscillospiraceae bacterium]|nr:phage head closure protein [Oscillospiraceae bacterium]
MYTPKDTYELRTAAELFSAPTITTYNGVSTKTYSETGEKIFVNWKSRGGTETNVNGIISILDTAVVTTWYRPDITSGARLKLEDGRIYDIISEPENIEERNIFLQFKVQRAKGGV